MSADWRLNISDCFENELISAIELKTMMIERETTGMGLFTVSMDLNSNDLSSLNINDRKFYNLNYYSNSYPLNTFILKDAILISVTCEHNSRNNNMHVEASWNYYRESGDPDYMNEVDEFANFHTVYVDRSAYYMPQLSFELENKSNWRLFGF